MDKKIYNKKRFFFLAVTFFFFIVMLFLYINVSNIMYSNAGILLAIKETRNLKNIISASTFGEGQFNKDNLDDLIDNLEFYPPLIYLKLFNSDKTLAYKKGEDVLIEQSLSVRNADRSGISYKRTFLRGEKKAVYEVIIPVEDIYGDIKWYLNILFDLQIVDDSFFNEKRVIFLIVFIVNLFIISFLMMMVLNLQKRLFIMDNELMTLNVNDKLTGLLSKDAFLNEMRLEIDRIRSNGGVFSLITADIDNFVDINDKCGYDFGDHILKNISSAFKETFRNFDCIGRFGGDEVVVLMIGAGEAEAVNLAEKCRFAVMETNFFFEGSQIPVTMSFGVSSTNSISDTDSNEENIKRSIFRNIMFNSLNALSRAKRSGKNMSVGFSQLANNKQIKL